jgi:hypothetical protein
MDGWAMWNHPSKPADVSHYAYKMAEERGRRMAAEALRLDAPKRRECEEKFGLAYCKSRWPEAYQGPVRRFFGALIG